MYQDHFGLYTAPFALSPRLQFLFKSSSFEETMAHLVYGLHGGEDFVLITGEIGIGKTLALQHLVQHVSTSYKVALVNVTQVDFRELLKLVLAELDVAVPTSADRADLLTALKTRLVDINRDGMRLLLIVDEAQNLSVETLEGVRLLSNLAPQQQQSLQIVISGQPGLRAHIDKPELAQLRQRIRVHYHLEPLTAAELQAYVDHRTTVAGAERSLFTRDAVARIHELSGGVPRLVNILADRALLAAYVEGASAVSGAHVEDDESIVRSPESEVETAARAAESSELVAAPPPTPPASATPPPPPAPDPDPEPDPVSGDESVDEDVLEPAPHVLTDRPEGGRGGRIALVTVLVLATAVAVWWFGPWRQGESPNAAEPTVPVVTAVPDTIATTPAEAAADTMADEPVVTDSESVPQDVPVTAEDEVPGDAVAEGDPTSGDPTSGEPDPAAAETVAEDADALSFHAPDLTGLCVHVGSFRDELLAASLSRDLVAHDLPAVFKSAEVDGATWFRVYVGPWETLEEAQDAQGRVTDAGLASWTMITRVR